MEEKEQTEKEIMTLRSDMHLKTPTAIVLHNVNIAKLL